MPWPFFIPEFLKRRACRYLLHYYLGQFLEEKISLEDLTIDLYNGTGSVSNVPLNVETINEVLTDVSAPVQVTEGYIGCVRIYVPWASLMSSSCTVEISDLNITVAPSYTQYNENVSMTDSLFFNMSKSRQLAEEVLKTPPTSTDDEELEMSGFEGMEVLAKAIEAILLRVQISLVDATINICQHSPSTAGTESGNSFNSELSLHISKVEFFDELTLLEEDKVSHKDETTGESEEAIHLPEVGDFATKILRLSGLTIELNNTGNGKDNIDTGVPIACASGEVDVRVKIKQSDTVPGPKLDIQVLLESIHMLLYPQQLHILLELVNGIVSEFDKVKPAESPEPHSHAVPGRNRPIPKHDMQTIETQLVNHIDIERRKKKAEEELLQQDPWNIGGARGHMSSHMSSHMTDSMQVSTTSDMFYSFDLQSNENQSSPQKGETPHENGMDLEQGSSKLRPFPLSHSTSQDQCIYSISLGGITCAVLENKPVHTHLTRGSGRNGSNEGSETDSYTSAKADSDPYSLGSNPELCSLDEGGLDPFKYFDCIRDVLKGRIGPREIKSCEHRLGQVLPADHIFLWMSTINVKISTEGPSTDLTLTIVSAELQEYLYHNEASLPLTTPVSIQSLIQFQEDSLNHTPCLSLQLSSKSQSPPSTLHKSSQKLKSSPTPCTDVDLSLAHIHLYIDVTIIDRLHELLHPLPPRNSNHRFPSTGGETLYYPSVNTSIHGNQQKKFVSQVLFSEAMSSSNASSNAHKLTMKVNTKTFDISLRFPVADQSNTVRPPWYRPPLRTEVLFVEFLNLSLSSTVISPSVRSLTVSTSFETAKIYLSLDGSYDSRQLFMIFEGFSDERYPKSKLDTPSIKITYQMLEESPLESSSNSTSGRLGTGSGIGSGLRLEPFTENEDEDVYGVVDELSSTEPSPFSQRNEKVLFSPEKVKSHDENSSSRQIILPASPKELQQYESHLTSTSTFSVSVSIPSASIHIPSKLFLKTLFDRISVDLSLWQPASPADVEKATARSVFYSSADILQPAMSREDKFKLCKSVLKESSIDEDHASSVTFSSLLSPTHSDPPKAPTFMMTSCTIDRGTISLALPIKTETTPSFAPPMSQSQSSPAHLLDLSPRRNHSPSPDIEEMGLLVMETRGCHVCVASNYEGEEERSQTCCQVEELFIHHCSCLSQPLPSVIDSKTLHLDTSDIQLKSFLSPWSYTNHDTNGRGRGRGPSDTSKDPVLSVSMDSQTEKDTHRRVHKVAIQLSGALLNYCPAIPQYTVFYQCGELFQFEELVVPGYDPPTVITELYINLKQSGLQYRPTHIPSHGVLTFDDLSLSTTLVTDSPLLVMDLLIDQMRLFVSNKHQKLDNICLKQDFVCVLEMNIFQLVLRLCNKTDMSTDASKLFSHIPEVDLQCSGSELHMMFCVDSCSVLRDLIIYLAENKDLMEDTTREQIGHSEPCTESTDNGTESRSSTGPHSAPPPSIMVTSTIGDLISEAMDDHDNGDCISDSSRNSRSTTPDHRITTSPVRSMHSTRPTPASSTSSSIMAETPAAAATNTNILVFSSDSEPDTTIDTDQYHNPQPSLSTDTTQQQQLQQKQSLLKKKKMEQAMADEWEIDEDDYCILAPPTTTKVGPSAEPVVKCLLNEDDPFRLVDNYYQVPDIQIDQLKRPKHFPNSVTSYALRELTIVWHLYGGRDFTPVPTPSSSAAAASPSAPKKHKAHSSSGEDQVAFHNGGIGGSQCSWIRKGGLGRDHNVLMEFELNKLRLQYESYPDDTEQSSRMVLLIRDIEIKDKLTVSRINKFLYHYSTEARPRQSHANMFTFKVLLSRPDSNSSPASEDSFQSLEATVRISMLPLRLNIDQDAFYFLYEFFDNLLPQPISSDSNPTAEHHPSSLSTNTTSSHTPLSNDRPIDPSSNRAPPTNNGNVFIKSFVFYPDVPIRLDYEAKRFHSTQLSTLTSMLLGLSHLDNSEVTLKALTYQNGVLGWNQLMEQVVSDWVQDIQRYQLPRILQGVGPVYHVTQLFQGALDLFWLPVQQYQEDGRILWGIQRGANSFAFSSGVAVVELSNRMLQSVEGFAQTAFDMVSTRERRQVSNQLLETTFANHQPADLREGIANAYNVVSTGIGDTAWDLYDAAANEHSEYGMTGAVGGVLKNIPGTIVRPIIFMSEATRHVIGGMKNQFVPEARDEANNKWKT